MQYQDVVGVTEPDNKGGSVSDADRGWRETRNDAQAGVRIIEQLPCTIRFGFRGAALDIFGCTDDTMLTIQINAKDDLKMIMF